MRSTKTAIQVQRANPRLTLRPAGPQPRSCAATGLPKSATNDFDGTPFALSLRVNVSAEPLLEHAGVPLPNGCLNKGRLTSGGRSAVGDALGDPGESLCHNWSAIGPFDRCNKWPKRATRRRRRSRICKLRRRRD